MKLKHVERINVIGAILSLLSLALAYGDFGDKLTQIFMWIAIGIVFVLLLINLKFNRCPKCGSYLWRTGDFCTCCGENLQRYR